MEQVSKVANEALTEAEHIAEADDVMAAAHEIAQELRGHPETAAMAVNFAKVLGELAKVDPERRFDITPSAAADALRLHAATAEVALKVHGDSDDVRRQCAEVLMAVGCLLAGLTEAQAG